MVVVVVLPLVRSGEGRGYGLMPAAAAAPWTRGTTVGLGGGLITILGRAPATLLHPGHSRPLHLPGHNLHFDGLARLTCAVMVAVAAAVSRWAAPWQSCGLGWSSGVCAEGAERGGGSHSACVSITDPLAAGGVAESSLA